MAKHGEHLAEAITRGAGTMAFVYAHLVWWGVWFVVNTLWIHIDAYPFNLLTMILSLEAILLGTFILITQNRQAAHAERVVKADAQVNREAKAAVKAMQRDLAEIKATLADIDFKQK